MGKEVHPNLKKNSVTPALEPVHLLKLKHTFEILTHNKAT